MTLKNTVLISAATYFALNFILWALGWMIWPIVWLAMGYGSVKIWTWVNRKLKLCDPELEPSIAAIVIILGPIMGIVAFFADGIKFVSWPKRFPKIRNPFFWPQKELDKQETKE